MSVNGSGNIVNGEKGCKGTVFKVLDRFYRTEGGKQSSKGGAKADAHGTGKGILVRVGSTSDSTELRQKLMECAIEANKVYAHTQ